MLLWQSGNNVRWIGFSEDDVRSVAEMATSGDEAHFGQRVRDNAFHLNRFAQRTREIDREFLHKRCDRAMAEAAAWDAAAATA